ncbi:metal-dependent hydrolase [Halorubrum pallidum]|uniref:Metal-dependent hydrolase n=1 Tax=Halorubrum pallidum TaxID=1526114 RepID=A0ABD5T1T2_9EURY
MAEWLTHVLLAYATFRILSWYVEWLDSQWISVGMVGAILPDLSRLNLVISSDIISYFIGSEFDWFGIHTAGGIILLSGIGALLFRDALEQQKAFIMLLSGSISHILVDLPQRYADGKMILDMYAFPLPLPRPVTPGWYVTPDRWVVLVAFVTAIVVFFADQHRKSVK